MKNLKVEIKLRKYALRITITRNILEKNFDVLLFLEFGYAYLPNYFECKGIFFYIDVLRFKVDEGYQAKGFSLPIRRLNRKKYENI